MIVEECAASPSAAWSTAFEEAKAITQPADEAPFAIAPDGKSYFADRYTGSWSGIVRVDLTTGATEEVYAFPNAGIGVFKGAFDSRWLVWTLTAIGSGISNPYVLMAWDSETGKVTTLSSDGDGGYDFVLPDSGLAARLGLLAWISFPRSNEVSGKTTVLDLLSASRRSLTTGGSALGFFSGRRYIFARVSGGAHPKGEWLRGSGSLSVDAVLARQWHSTRAPEGASAVFHLADHQGHFLAFPESWSGLPWSTTRALYFWPGRGGDVYEFSTGAAGSPGVAVADGNLIGWASPQGGDYVASLASGSYLLATGQTPTTAYGLALAHDEMLLSQTPLSSAQPVTTAFVVGGAPLPFPACP
ncbi:MAG: hypothetical protein ACRENX_04215 [Candidatus Dormibacteria bacterium]